jgi:hypothetical protein
MTTQKYSLIRQLPEAHRKLVRRIVDRGGGGLSRGEFFRREKARDRKQIDRYSGLSHYDVLLRNLKANNEGCTEEEVEAMAVANLYGRDLLRRGIARRILRDDPGELEAALSLQARLDWLEMCEPAVRRHDTYPDVWMVFHGLAAGDHEVARAFFGPRPRALSGGHEATVLIYNAVQAIVTGNRRAQARLRPEIEYPDVSDRHRAILRTLHGIIIADATAVAVNLGQVLAKSRRIDRHDPETVIAILAHGLAELAYWVSPGLLGEFDLDSPWPWDGAYQRWLHRRNRSTRYRDLSKYSALLNRWIHDLEEPGWWHRGKGGGSAARP